MWISRGGRSSSPHASDLSLSAVRSLQPSGRKGQGTSLSLREGFEIVKTTRDSADNFSSFHCICVSAHGRGDGNLTDGDITLIFGERRPSPAYYLISRGRSSALTPRI